MANNELAQKIDRLADLIHASRRLVVFTGAGIGTESGVPDFRGPDGIWTRKAKGLSNETKDWSKAAPNAGHLAIVELQRLKKLKFLISQNVDNLHLKSGIDPAILAELHGNLTKIRCRLCEFSMDNFGDTSLCPLCGGEMKPSVVDFGQSLPREALNEAVRQSQDCDLFLVAGSSPVVYPAADMPRLAVEQGAKLVIINEGETTLDAAAELKFEERIGLVLPPAIEKLKTLMAVTRGG
jgi:NAD-dependent SIR2 family protein deacetylase